MIEEDRKYAGYLLIVTSELDMDDLSVYNAYRELGKIKEAVQNTKACLDNQMMDGQLLIGYLSFFLLKVLEKKVFKDQIGMNDLIEFIKDFKIAQQINDSYINISNDQDVNERIKTLTDIDYLDALYLTKEEI